MARFTPSELQTLMAIPGPCVSIYLPTHAAGPEIRQDPIRFKNLLKAAEESLLAQGMRRSEVLGLLEPLQELDNGEFWRHQDRGLAAFAARDFVRYYRLSLEFEALALVAEHFHLTPLLPLLTGDGRFYILALNQSHLRLLEASRDRVRELELSNLEDVPESLVEAVYQYESTAKQSQFETTAAAAPGGLPGSAPGTLHGRGVDEDKQSKLLQFFSRVDSGLRELFQGDRVPLVLVGLSHLQPIYQQANRYPHLLAEGVAREPKLMKPEELRDAAWSVVAPYFQQAQMNDAEAYAELSGNSPDLTSEQVEAIVRGAYYQRVQTLFVALDRHQWGQFDSEGNTVTVHQEKQPEDEDLLALAALHTLANGGTVYAVAPEAVPAASSAAAIFRFPEA